jgi:hypothetical protein
MERAYLSIAWWRSSSCPPGPRADAGEPQSREGQPAVEPRVGHPVRERDAFVRDEPESHIERIQAVQEGPVPESRDRRMVALRFGEGGCPRVGAVRRVYQELLPSERPILVRAVHGFKKHGQSEDFLGGRLEGRIFFLRVRSRFLQVAGQRCEHGRGPARERRSR